MTEIIKYEKLKELKNRLLDLHCNFFQLVNSLDSRDLDNTFKKELKKQAWKVAERIKEVINEYGEEI